MDLSDIFDTTDTVYVSPPPPSIGTLVTATSSIGPQYLFFAVNPVDPNWRQRASQTESGPTTPRFGLNVTKFRNFIFESDADTPENQLNEWLKISLLIPIKRITFSGGKSYHAIISVIDELGFEPHTHEGIRAYSQAWKGLKGFIEEHSILKLDASTKDPSRLTRLPGAIRGDNEQKPVQFNSRYISSAELMKIMAEYAPIQSHVVPVLGTPTDTQDLQTLLRRPMHKHLYSKLENPEKWVKTESMYPEIFRLTLWAIDSLNPTLEAWSSIMESKVFPTVRAMGYKRDLTLGIKNAYNYKGLY